MPSFELTESQLKDLARYFLGPDWRILFIGEVCYLIGVHRTFFGYSPREVFRHAGVNLPSRQLHVQMGRRVMLGRNCIQICRSNSEALKATRALNRVILTPATKG